MLTLHHVIPLDVGTSDVAMQTASPEGPTLPASNDREPLTESTNPNHTEPSDPTNSDNSTETVPMEKEPVTEAYYYQKMRESAYRFGHHLSTSKYVDDVELTWRGFDDKKKELVITSAMRFISFDPEADFNRFDDFAMAAMTSVMLKIVRTNRNKKSLVKKPVANPLLRRAVTFQAATRDNI